MERFKGKIALVTGGANGLGESIVRRLVEEGAQVAIIDIEADRLEAVCASLSESTFGVHADVSDKKQVDAAIEKIITQYGHIDILFNNAGIMLYDAFLDIKEEDWDKTLNTNAKGYFLVGQAVAKSMVEKNIEGIIVNTCSVSADCVSPTVGAYVSSKGAVMQLTKAMAVDLAPYNIRVNALAPGSMMTRMTEKTRNNPERMEMFMKNLVVKRYGDPYEVAGLALFLASDDAAYICGEMVYVDGGLRIR